MGGKVTTRLAGSVSVVSVILALAALTFEALSRAAIVVGSEESISPPDVVVALTYSIVGGIIASRRPRNPIGWILCAGGCFSGVSLFSQGYSTYALLARPDALPGGVWAAWAAAWSWIPSLGVLPLLLLLFPTGRVLSPRWRVVAWVTSVSIVGACAVASTLPFELIAPQLPVDNPMTVGLARSANAPAQALFAAVLFGSLISSVVSIFLRFRRANAEERSQLKWLGYAGFFLIASLGLNLALFAGSDSGAGAILPSLGVAAIPVGMGVSILKFRLYDIDRVVSRTLLYAVLTAFLGAAYFVAVVSLQALLGERVGTSPLAVAATTLGVAALFGPARARIQGGIDRRFNRRKYDTAQALEAFAARLRDEIDLDTLTADLLGVVDNTMQPTHSSLWLRSSMGRTA